MDPITIRYAFRPVRRSLATGQVTDLFGLAPDEPAHTVADGLELDVRAVVEAGVLVVTAGLVVLLPRRVREQSPH